MSAVETIGATWGWLVFGSELGAIVLTPRVLLSQKPAGSTFAWLFTIWLLPIAGPLLFLTFGRDRIERGLPRRKRRASAATRGAFGASVIAEPEAKGGILIDPASLVPTELAQLASATERLCGAPLLGGNQVTLLSSAAAMYEAMLDDVAVAATSIHVEFYIWRDDWSGNRLASALIARAATGIEVRALFDAVGCYDLGAAFLERLRAAGVEVAFFHPVNPLRRRFNVNLRNHRKIAVVDGAIAYTGGINIGDEYLGLSEDIGPWRDTAVRIEGPAARMLQRVFCEDWYFSSGSLPPRPSAFPTPPRPRGPSAVQVVLSGPDEDAGYLHRVYFLAVTLARQRVLITTPYFVPDDALSVALETAALRGVDVRVLVPRRADNRLVDAACRAYAERMVRRGVRVFFYEHGFVHAKTVVVDGVLGAVGSANMDVRSFRLNFEAGALIYDPAIAAALESDFARDLGQSREATLADLEGRGMLLRVLDELARLAGPLL